MFPRIPGFTNILTRGLTYGHLVDLYIQTLTQPRLHYSEMETNDINGNTGNWFHILSNDEQTNEALSKQLGEIEVQTESVNSQIGLDRQDRGNRMVQVNKVRLLDAKEIGELTPREMITIRTIKRTDKKGNDVRPLPIFATENFTLPMAYKLLGKKFSLDYYTADLNLKAQHNSLAYDDLYQNFKPFFEELSGFINDTKGSDRQLATTQTQTTIVDEVVPNDKPKVDDNTSQSDAERIKHWYENIDWDGPFLTEEQLMNKALTHSLEDLIRLHIPRNRSQNSQQVTASTALLNHTFMDQHQNNNYQFIFDLIGQKKAVLWQIYQEISQEGEF